jgi:hypothetical protein
MLPFPMALPWLRLRNRPLPPAYAGLNPQWLRVLQAGKREQITELAAQITAAGQVDAYANCLLYIRRRAGPRPLSERQRRATLSALVALWGGLGRDLAIALDAKTPHFEREAAYRSLVQRRDQRAVDPLCEALLAGHLTESWQCVAALGQLGDPRAATALLTYLDLDGTTANQPSADEVALEVGRALRQLNAWAGHQQACAALSNKSRQIRAALLLAGWGASENSDKADAAILAQLEAMLQQADFAGQQAAATALGAMGTEQSLKALQTWAKQPACTDHAEQMIGQIMRRVAKHKTKPKPFAGLPRHREN